MLAMVRAAAPLLLLSAACAASVAPAATDAKSTEKLEALVRDMAKGQQEAAASAPTPKALDEDVMIFEGAERRRLGACSCSGGYRNGAHAGVPVCSKKEGRKNVCFPTMSNGMCNFNEATLCTAGSPVASPTPTTLDAEEVEGSMFVDVNMQLYSASASNQLPAPDAIAQVLASYAGVPVSRVSVLTTWDTSGDVRLPAGAVVQQPTEANAGAASPTWAHASIAVGSAAARDALASSLTDRHEMPSINGFQIVATQVFQQSSNRQCS